jgi:hypothetical protein
VQFAVTFANGTKPDAVYDGCVTKLRGATVVGLIVSVQSNIQYALGPGSRHHPAA